MKSNNILVSVIALLVALAALTVSVCNITHVFERSAPTGDLVRTRPEDPGGAVISDVTENGVKLVSTRIAAENYAANGVSPLAEAAYTLTATVTPENAIDKTVDWSVAFTNPESTWATGKTVENYVSVTPESDGSNVAVVQLLAPFGEQVIVSVTSRQMTSVNAKCVVDYLVKVDTATISLGTDFILNTDMTDYTFTKKVASKLRFSFDPVFTIGSLTADRPEAEYYLKYSSEFINSLTAAGIGLINNAGERQPIAYFDGTYYAGREILDQSYVYPGDTQDLYALIGYRNGLGYKKVVEILNNMQGNTVCTLEVDYNLGYFTQHFAIDLKFKPELYEAVAENIALDNTHIVF